MGRKQVADRDALLDAAERVVLRHGAVRLSLDAVATEAGVSKSSVLYEVGSKQGLIRALISRRIEEFHARSDACEARLTDHPNAAVHALIAVGSEPETEEQRALGFALTVALAQDDALREPIRKMITARIDQLLERSPNPTGSLIALLAMEGLMSLERFDIYQFDPQKRAKLIAAISWLADQMPGACGLAVDALCNDDAHSDAPCPGLMKGPRKEDGTRE